MQGISGVTTDLQRTILRARLQPVGGLFGRFNRIVRELGQKLDKEIVLETVGNDVELDRALIEGLSDPLTHPIRNCADHGIEPAAERLRLGKPAAGHVRISAAHLAGRVQIEVRDDGRGLNPELLKAKAVEKGLLATDQATRMTVAEAWQLIFAPGFSTAAVVSDVSGRGMGMDVVKTNIERLGGRVEIESAVRRNLTEDVAHLDIADDGEAARERLQTGKYDVLIKVIEQVSHISASIAASVEEQSATTSESVGTVHKVLSD